MHQPSRLILTADPSSGALDESACHRVRNIIETEPRWLAPGAAVQFETEASVTRRHIAPALSGLPIDINVVADCDRAKKLLVADMDSTVIEQEMIDELASLTGRRDEIAAITLATMRGDLDFKQSLRRRVALLTGLTTAHLEEVAAHITLMPGAAPLVSTMRANGAVTALVSGGFTVFVEHVAARLGFDRHFGNVLDVEAGRLTGRVFEPILDAMAKRDLLLDLAHECGLAPANVIAVGDGANDLPMLEAAGLGVAFRAKPAVRTAMLNSPTGAVIDHADLSALLHLQGLPSWGG
ncbi:MAG: phosphoserine phosphatase SerB [Hyphomicrobium sp.]|nr:phosphoserine phosphatase SerB [Hyphomicrobium sp.]